MVFNKTSTNCFNPELYCCQKSINTPVFFLLKFFCKKKQMDLNVLPKPIPYNNDEIKNMVESLQSQPSIASLGTDFIEAIISVTQLPPSAPWVTPVTFQQYKTFLLGMNAVGKINPVTVLIGTFTFLPQVTITQPFQDIPYYEWVIEKEHIPTELSQQARAKFLWAGPLEDKPDYFIEERPDDPLIPENTTTYFRIENMDNYTVLFYYRDGDFYNFIFPVDTPNINTVAFHTNASMIKQISEDEYDQRIMSVQ